MSSWLLPRFKVTAELNSRILAMKSRSNDFVKMQVWDMLTCSLYSKIINLFTSDGLHLSKQGKQLYAETLKVNINKFDT